MVISPCDQENHAINDVEWERECEVCGEWRPIADFLTGYECEQCKGENDE